MGRVPVVVVSYLAGCIQLLGLMFATHARGGCTLLEKSWKKSWKEVPVTHALYIQEKVIEWHWQEWALLTWPVFWTKVRHLKESLPDLLWGVHFWKKTVCDRVVLTAAGSKQWLWHLQWSTPDPQCIDVNEKREDHGIAEPALWKPSFCAGFIYSNFVPLESFSSSELCKMGVWYFSNTGCTCWRLLKADKENKENTKQIYNPFFPQRERFYLQVI